MPEKLFIKTTNPDFYFQIEFLGERGFETSGISAEQVPAWITTGAKGRATLHPYLIKTCRELGKSVHLELAEPVEYWAV